MIYACMWHRVVDAPAGLPGGTVFLDCRPADGGFPAVVPDDRARRRWRPCASSSRAGHRRIAYVDVDEPHRPSPPTCATRGTSRCSPRPGSTRTPRCTSAATPRPRAGGRPTDRLLDLPEDRRPTAIFCFNDRMAVGVYVAAHRRGLRIPHDLSIVGYDDQQLVAAELDPPLTTVALPHYEMGRWAMEVALGIRDAGRTPTPHTSCPARSSDRDSVGPPPATAASNSRRRT